MLKLMPDPGVTGIFSFRASGNMSLFYGDTKDALANRKNFLAGCGIDYQDLVCAKQVHGNRVRVVTEKERGSGALTYDSSLADTDALVTDKKNLPLAIFTADCLSVYLYDPDKPAIGLAHAGWRSSKENITAATIKLMKEKFNTRPENLYAAFGPSLRKCCYDVGEEFREHFTPEHLLKRDNRIYLDLIGINRKQLLESGMKEKNIFDSAICTSCRNNEFFSFRKEDKESGRMISVIMLRS